MLLRNTGSKIVNIGKDILLPGDQKTYPKSVLTPALELLIAFGYLTAFDDPAPAAQAEAPVEVPVEVPAEEPEQAAEAPKKTTTRKKKASE